MVKLRALILAGLILAIVLSSVGCHNDRSIIDKHEQTLHEEND